MAYETEFVLFPNDMNALLEAFKGNYVQTLLAVTQQDTPGMGVKVGSGDAMIAGVYKNKWQSTNVAIAAADTTYPRKDIVCMKPDGTLVSSDTDAGCKGTPAEATPSGKTGPKTQTPLPPTLPTGYLLLAEVWVPANATQILNANIADKRVLWFQKFPQNMGDVHNMCTVATEGGYMRDGYFFFMLGKGIRFSSLGGINHCLACCDTQPLRGYGVYQWRMYFENWQLQKSYAVGFWWHYRCGLAGAYFDHQTISGPTERKCVVSGEDGSMDITTLPTWDPTTEVPYKIDWKPEPPTSTGVKFYINGSLVATHTTYVPNKDIHLGFEIEHLNRDTDFSDHSKIWFKDFERTE